MRSAGNFHPEWGYLAPAPSFMRTARVVVVATAIGATAGAGVVLTLIKQPESNIGKTPVEAHALVTSTQAATPPATAPATAAVNVPPNTSPVQAQIPTSPPRNQTAQQTPAAVSAQAKVHAQTVTADSPSAPVQAQAPASATAMNGSQPVTLVQPSSTAASDAGTTSTPQAPSSVAALAEIPAVMEASPTLPPKEVAIVPNTDAAPQKAAKKHRTASEEPPRGIPANAAIAKRTSSPDKSGLAPLLMRLFSARSSSDYSN